MMEIVAHRLQQASFVSSPNYNSRPDDGDINLLVIHGISLPAGEFGGPEIEALFTNQYSPLSTLKVSAHLLIRRDGSMTQFVPFDKRAWHAGVSCFQGRENCNDFSIGIELEGCDHIPYEDLQYKQLAMVTRALLVYYPNITAERIVGHCDIAPGRKTDPGQSFDWDYYQRARQNDDIN